MSVGRGLSAVTLAVVLGASACDGGSADDGDPGQEQGEPGSPSIECESYDTLEIGRCVQEASGEDCTGELEEVMTFVALEAGDPMRMVVGPQAATMLVFLARTQGIDPGVKDDPTNQTNPLIEAELVEDGALVSHARLRSSFTDMSGELLSDSGIFLIIEEDPLATIGRTLEVRAQVSDQDGNTRCGRVEVSVEG